MLATKFKPEDLQNMNAAVTALREAVEGKTQKTEEEIQKLNKILDEYEKKNQKILAERQIEKQKEKALKEQIEVLEKKVVDLSLFKQPAVGLNKKVYKDSNEYKALNEYSKKGMDSLDLEYKDYLRTDIGSQGGFLIPPTMVNFMLNEIQEVSPVRQFARKLGPIETKSVQLVVGVGIPDAPFEKELEEGPKSTPTYRLESLTAFAQQTTIPISRDLLAFSNFDMDEITKKVNKAFAKGEGNRFLLGSGVKEPEGILVNPNIARIDTKTSATLSMDDVIKLSGETKVGYLENYFFNKKTLVALRVEKNNNGNYLWRIGGESMPSEINGFPYIIFQDMPDVALDALPVGFGDIFEGYLILDSIQMSMIRDEYTPKEKRAVEFTFFRYLNGQVVLPEAIKLLKVKS
jgi:HK97 family phage major capsid protein